MYQLCLCKRSSFIITDLVPINTSTLWNLRSPHADREFKAVIHRCDICDDKIEGVGKIVPVLAKSEAPPNTIEPLLN
jgi:hypothetical protein